MNAPDVIELREWEKLRYDYIGNERLRRLEEASNRLDAWAFDFYLHEMRARNYVGVVSAGETTVQILPKTHHSDSDSLAYLLALLGYTKKLETKRGDATNLEEHRGSFLEVWISYFARELNHLLRRNYKQRYIEIEERTAFVRGKLLTERDMDGRSGIYARYPCRYEVFTPDHLLNRTLKFCNRLLMKQSRSPKNRAILRENDVLLADVEDVPVLARDLQHIHLDRLNREYQPMLDLCRLLLENSTLDLRAGRITQLAILFDMDKLFEEFVAEFLKGNREKIRIGGSPIKNVETQKNLGKLFDEFRMDVDIVLHTEDEKYLLDTKNKRLNDEKPHSGLSQSDFCQVYGYLRAGVGTDENRYKGVYLLYPRTDVSPGDEDFINSPDDASLFVRTVDIAACHNEKGDLNIREVIERFDRAFGTVEVRKEVPV